ncbi:MAG: PAS domain S-box protein, partial [Steroidobacteraceae bacterium]
MSAIPLSRLSTVAFALAFAVLVVACVLVEFSPTSSTRAVLVALLVAVFLLLIAALWINRRALEELRKAESIARFEGARLRVTLQSCGDALIATDVAGNIVLINPVAQALTGWREEQARGLPIEQVFHIVNEFTRESVENPVSRALREGKVVGLANHTLLIARDATERPIDDSGAPIKDENGESIGVILVFRDVSGRKLAEQARERLLRAEAEREAAVEANHAKDEFLALVSHEL